MNDQFLQEIRKLAEDISKREGCYLYDIEFVGSGTGRTLRVYIDRDVLKSPLTDSGEAQPGFQEEESADSRLLEQPPGGRSEEPLENLPSEVQEAVSSPGASIEDCSNVSRALNLSLDVNDIIPGGRYQLEVSTPGLERVLKESFHFQKALGKKICVKCRSQLLNFNPSCPELGLAKQITGSLVAFDEQTGLRVATELSDRGVVRVAEVIVPRAEILKANIVFDFPDNSKNKLGKNSGKNPGKPSGKKSGKNRK